jgi:hypothetical protein
VEAGLGGREGGREGASVSGGEWSPAWVAVRTVFHKEAILHLGILKR